MRLSTSASSKWKLSQLWDCSRAASLENAEQDYEGSARIVASCLLMGSHLSQFQQGLLGIALAVRGEFSQTVDDKDCITELLRLNSVPRLVLTEVVHAMTGMHFTCHVIDAASVRTFNLVHVERLPRMDRCDFDTLINQLGWASGDFRDGLLAFSKNTAGAKVVAPSPAQLDDRHKRVEKIHG